jgi:hypothetical protein
MKPFTLPQTDERTAQTELLTGGPSFLKDVDPTSQPYSGILLLHPVGTSTVAVGVEAAQKALKGLGFTAGISETRSTSGLLSLTTETDPGKRIVLAGAGDVPPFSREALADARFSSQSSTGERKEPASGIIIVGG